MIKNQKEELYYCYNAFESWGYSQRIVSVLELAGGVMEEFSNPSGPRKELVNSHCSEFMQLIKVLSFFISLHTDY